LKVADDAAGGYLTVINTSLDVGKVTDILFDFDGTISVIRQGWQDVMVPMMLEVLLETPEHEDEDALTARVRDFVDLLTGKDTKFIEKAERDSGREVGGYRAPRHGERSALSFYDGHVGSPTNDYIAKHGWELLGYSQP